MKFQPDTLAGTNVVSRLDGPRVWVGPRAYEGSLLVPWRGEVCAWEPTSHAALRAEHFEALLELNPELVIFGSGARLRFAPPAPMKALFERRVGIETMDNGAACRTYNVLASEGRAVLLALLVESDNSAPL
jgi:uncharacterized protein